MYIYNDYYYDKVAFWAIKPERNEVKRLRIIIIQILAKHRIQINNLSSTNISCCFIVIPGKYLIGVCSNTGKA